MKRVFSKGVVIILKQFYVVFSLNGMHFVVGFYTQPLGLPERQAKELVNETWRIQFPKESLCWVLPETFFLQFQQKGGVNF